MFSPWTLVESSPCPGYSEFHNNAHCWAFIFINPTLSGSFQSGNWCPSVWGIKKKFINSLSLFFVLSSWNLNCACPVYLAGSLLSLTFSPFLLYCCSWSFWLTLWGQLLNLFLLPIFHSKKILFSKTSSLLIAFYFYFSDALGFLLSLRRVFICFYIFPSWQACFLQVAF